MHFPRLLPHILTRALQTVPTAVSTMFGFLMLTGGERRIQVHRSFCLVVPLHNHVRSIEQAVHHYCQEEELGGEPGDVARLPGALAACMLAAYIHTHVAV